MRCPRGTYPEFEYVCANPDYCGYEEKIRAHEQAFRLLNEAGLLPYRQRFDYGTRASGDTWSLSAIALGRNRHGKVRSAVDIGKQLGLEVDVVECRDNRFIDRIINGSYGDLEAVGGVPREY